MRSIELLMAVGTGQISLKQHQKRRDESASSNMESGSDAASDARYSRESQREFMHISALEADFNPDGISSAAPRAYSFGLRHILTSGDQATTGSSGHSSVKITENLPSEKARRELPRSPTKKQYLESWEAAGTPLAVIKEADK
jgi:hypothetical protein